MAFNLVSPSGAQAGSLAAQMAKQQPATPYTDPASIERKRALAQFLAQQSQQPVDTGLGAVSSIAQALAGRFQEKRADKLDAQNAQNRQETLAMVLAEPDPEKRAMLLGRAQDPNLQAYGLERSMSLGDERRKQAREDAVESRRRGYAVEDREDSQSFDASQANAARGFSATEAEKSRKFSSEENALDRGASLASAQAKAALKAQTDAAKAGEKARLAEEGKKQALETWRVSRNGLMSALEKTETGPVRGRLPAYSAPQQTAEGAIAATAPVLKQIFRVSGEGVFTDKDQQLLLDMVPKRTDRPEARASKIRNIDAIINAKLGGEPEAAALPDGVTEDDIAFTMQKHGLSREQVLQRLGGM